LHIVPTLDGLDQLDATARLHCEQVLLLLGRITAELHLGYQLAATLYDDQPLAPDPAPAPLGHANGASASRAPAPPAPPVPFEDATPSLPELIRDNLTPDSVLFRHAIRMAATATAAEAFARALHLERGYWVTITVVILLQPYTPATVTKTLQRVIGTVLGATVAALVVQLVHERAALMAIATVLAAVSAAVLQLNYALYSFFMTPTFVLLAEAGAKDPRLPALRIVNTLIGGLFAFAGARLLWPHVERRRFPEELASALMSLREYLATVIEAIVGRVPPPSPSLRAARRRFGLAINRADASFQRLLAEAPAQAPALEPAMTALLFARRVSASIGAAGSARHLLPPTSTTSPSARDGYAIDHALAELDKTAGEVLVDLAVALRELRPPAPLPPLVAQSALLPAPLFAARFHRLAEQLAVLHQAVARWLTPLRPR
jgi:uncharacterized membrane protein YccC